MADSNEPKKETGRITVPAQPSSPPQAQSQSRDTVRIHLPTRPPANPSPAQLDSPCPARSAAAAMPAPSSPKKETARITVLADPRLKPAVEMKKTQPLIDLPRVEKPAMRIIVTSQPQPEPEPISTIDNIPMPLCWALLGVSAVILILQIWNYVS